MNTPVTVELEQRHLDGLVNAITRFMLLEGPSANYQDIIAPLDDILKQARAGRDTGLHSLHWTRHA